MRDPVILVPGMLASQIRANVDKTSVPHIYCECVCIFYFSSSTLFISKQVDAYQLWVETDNMIPDVIDCWMDNVYLQYDNTSQTYTDAPGVSSYLLPGIDGLYCVIPNLCAYFLVHFCLILIS